VSSVYVYGSLRGRYPIERIAYSEARRAAVISTTKSFLPGERICTTLTDQIQMTQNALPIGWCFHVAFQRSRLRWTPHGNLRLNGSGAGLVAGDFAGRDVSQVAVTSYEDGSVMTLERSVNGFVSAPTAVYFDNKNFTGRQQSAVVDAIDFDFGNGAPREGMGADTFSIRFTGKIKTAEAGNYRFMTESDDGVRLWINNQKVIDQWNDHGPRLDTGEVRLAANTVYNLRLDYYENGGGAVIRLFWQPPGAAQRSGIQTAGAFVPGRSWAAGPGPFAATAGDWNLDGRLDMMVVNYSPNGAVYYLKNNGNGFDRVHAHSAGDDPREIISGDLNLDGLPDVIVANSGNNTVSVFYGDGDGIGGRPQLIRTGGFVQSVAMDDVDGDGDFDLLMVTEDPDALEVHLNQIRNGRSEFVSAGNYKTVQTPQRVRVADIDMDGDADVLVSTNSLVLRFINNASGGLTLMDPLKVDAGTEALHVADVNGDGVPDVLSASREAGTVQLYTGRGQARFNQPVLLKADVDPAALVVTDVDGDSVADLIISHMYRGRVLLFLQN
ncbi:MAG: VCBS repeat-containing protein, partial [Leptospiraceae bacterium]|nr:VCBS repeat-containing protein [Leptospiraceae bacterium]